MPDQYQKNRAYSVLVLEKNIVSKLVKNLHKMLKYYSFGHTEA
jgi:hypothetical protein